jgi:hypothetical protein
VSKKSVLDRVQIPKPCFADWERMVGTEQIRFCTECNKHVYNLSGMTRGEAEGLIASAPRGRLCARLTRDANGTTVTADAPPGIQLIWRRASPIANAVVSAMLTMATPGMARGGQIASAPASIASIIDGPDTRVDTQGAAAALSGTLLDSYEVVIPGATLRLTNEDTGDIQTATSSDVGYFRFFVLTEGVYTLKAESVGFRAVETNGLNLGQGQEQHLNITMEPAQATMGGAMIIPMLTLRELYAVSDRIVVARPAGTVKVKSEGESRLIRTSLMVSSTLKGDGEPVVNVYHFIYGDQETPFPRGENLLVFLKHGGTMGALKSAGGYELADFSHGIKKLSSSELDVYVQRINELAQLSHEQPPNQEELVEWLVRCAEDPATRWEGAFDLASSAADLRASCSQDDSDEDSGSSEESDEDQSDEPTAAVATVEPTPEPQELGDRATFAALLTTDQKQRLMKALLATEDITEGDVQLIELVKDRHDPRLLPFLVSQLHRVEANPPETVDRVVRVVAELLNDRRINALSKSYADAPYDVEEEDKDSGKTTSAAARERSALMRKFLEQVERKMRK